MLSPRSAVLISLHAALLVSMADAHGAMTVPPSRNAADRELPQFQGGKWTATGCNCGSPTGCELGTREAGGGQACLWFSQGCTIGCESCTGIGSHSDKPLCSNSTVKPTLPKYAWSMNLWAVEGSVNDR